VEYDEPSPSGMMRDSIADAFPQGSFVEGFLL